MYDDTQSLSEHFREILLDATRFPEFEGAENEKELVNAVIEGTRALINGREAFVEFDWAKWEPVLNRLVSDRPMQFDWEITSDLVHSVPDIVDRALKLSPLVGNRPVSRRVESLLREATRCYLFGFWQASISLCRAVVEHALGERVEELFGTTPGRFGLLIDFAVKSRVLDGATNESALVVKTTGDRVLHGGETNAMHAEEALDAARAVLEHLFR